MLVVPSSIAAPSAITIIGSSPTFGVDLSTVTAAHLHVIRRDGTTATWAAAIVSAVPGEIVLQYTFAGGEITTTGIYTLNPILTVPGGGIPLESVAMYVGASVTPALETSAWIAAGVRIPSLGPTKGVWTVTAASAYTAIATSPWLAVDLSGGAVTVNLWAAVDGDTVIITDFKGAASLHACTVVASAGQAVPTGVGTYGGSVSLNTAGFALRLKYLALTGQWLEW